MKVLIVGFGLVGRELANYLRTNMYEVHVVDPFVSDKFNLGLTIFRKSFREFLESNQEKYDFVINTAYPSKRDRNDSEDNIQEVTEAIADASQLYLSFFLSLESYLNEGGSLIQCASIYGCSLPRFEIYNKSERRTPPDYVFTKAGLIQLNKYYAKLYLKRYRLNTVSFGGVYNNHEDEFVKHYGVFTGSSGMLEAIDVVKSIEYIMKNKHTGTNLVVDDGFTL